MLVSSTPCPAPGPAGRYALAAQKHRDASHANRPAVTGRSGSSREQVAAKIDKAVLAKVVSQAVSQPALGNPAEVDTGAGPQAGSPSPHLEHLGQRLRWRRSSRRSLRKTMAQRVRVPDSQHGFEHSHMHESAAQTVTLERRVQHSAEL